MDYVLKRRSCHFIDKDFIFDHYPRRDLCEILVPHKRTTSACSFNVEIFVGDDAQPFKREKKAAERRQRGRRGGEGRQGVGE